MIQKVKAQMQGLGWLISGLWNDVYPDFVRRKVTRPTYVPVFSYHRIIPAEFEKQLQYLQENGYRTITCDEYLEMYQHQDKYWEKVVVLTFDDGLEDLYTEAFPLLKKYNFTAVTFLISNWIGRPGMVCWEQVREMSAAGVIDFQAHTAHHAAIPVALEVVDFYREGMEIHQTWNLPIQSSNGSMANYELPAIGTPIYKFASRISDNRRIYPPTQLAESCVDFVHSNGGGAFLNLPEGKKKLKMHFQKAAAQYAGDEKFETVEQQKEFIRQELIAARKKIEAEIPGKEVRHFAYPWNQTGEAVAQLLPECGYATAYGGLNYHYSSEGSPHNRYYINRVAGDYIFCLPGENRRGMLAILLSKIKRRLTKGELY